MVKLKIGLITWLLCVLVSATLGLVNNPVCNAIAGIGLMLCLISLFGAIIYSIITIRV